MTTKARLTRFTVPFVAGSLLLGGAGCASEKPPVAPTPSVVATAPVAPAPEVQVAIPVSPSVSVSDEIIKACKLNFDDVGSAPKFDFDQSVLLDLDDNVLGQIAHCVTGGPLDGRALSLVGRADPRGGSDYNLALGDRRATVVREYLGSLGVKSKDMINSSRGAKDAHGTDEQGWRLDRRVDVLLQ